MSSTQNKLDRIEAWLDRQNAKDDAAAKSLSAWWHAGKMAFGIPLLLKSVGHAMHATGPGSYTIALVLFAGGAGFLIEGALQLRQRWLTRDAAE